MPARSTRFFARDAADAASMRVLFDRLVLVRNTRLRPVGITSQAIDDGLVLADLLAMNGFDKLAENLSQKLLDIRARRAGWALGVPFLLRRVERAIEEVADRQLARLVEARSGLKRTRAQDAQLRASYEWFRNYGMTAANAWAHARAEQYAERHGWHIEFEPEEDSYQSVYGYSPENAALEAREWAAAVLLDNRGEHLDSLGFVEPSRDEERYQRASMTLAVLQHRAAVRAEATQLGDRSNVRSAR